ncbi:MAG TPA: type II toxin-antitoxin system VapC family toxin [Caulobacter sp.]|nr:type II toxin-antitoxin system VapC family toxin [Caulobacter sp.]
MTKVVVDASAALAWVLTSQRTPQSVAFLAEDVERSLCAPYILLWEMRNVLIGLERRGLLGADEHVAALELLDDFEIDIGPAPSDAALLLLSEQARRRGLSLFDASYLQLAIDLDCAIATRDAALVRAARDAGVACYDFLGV